MDYILKSSGGDQSKYLDYLLKRLAEFREAGRGFGQKFSGAQNFFVTRATIKKQMGCELNDAGQFEKVCAFIQAKINNTILGRQNAAKGRRSYHSFEEHGKPKSTSPRPSPQSGEGEDFSGPSLTDKSGAIAASDKGTVLDSPENNLGGPLGSGSSAPGALRAGHRSNSAVPTSDAAAGATQAEQPAPVNDRVGCDAPGDPSLALLTASMNHPAVQLTEFQLAEANERRLLLLAAIPFFEAGLSNVKVAATIGVDHVKLHRLLLLADHLTPALSPERRGRSNADRARELVNGPVAALAPKVSPGRGSCFEAMLLVPEIAGEINRLYMATMGASCAQATNDRRTGSIATTLLRLADFPAVPPVLVEKLRAGSKPKCLVDFIKATWTPEVEAKLRGQKHYGTATIAGRRELTEELSDGSRVPLQPGRVWVFDDMSSNIPFWFEVSNDTAVTADKGTRQLIERHGCCIGRQGLYAWDWASGAWLGVELVGRLRDAYQASDILRFIRKLVSIYGKPDKIVMERGVWQARSISGWSTSPRPSPQSGEGEEFGLVEITDGWAVPEMAADETAKISDGIRAIGVEIIHTYTPRGKPIEGAFNHHQRLVPTFLKPGEAVNIGRHAGEFEWSAKQHRRASNGVLHPRDLGFIHIDRLADVAWEAMQWEGAHDKAGRDGKPTVILTTWLQASPLPTATERDLAVFLPEKRSVTLRNGVLTTMVNSDTLQFLNPEYFAALGDGVRVEFAFDPAEPTLGAAIYNDKGFLCWANYLPPGPVISALDRRDDPSVQLIKRYKLAHRTAARMLDFRSLRTVATAERRDGGGQVATVTRNGGTSPQPSPQSGEGAGSRNAAPQRVTRSLLAVQTPEQISRQSDRFERLARRQHELAVLADGHHEAGRQPDETVLAET